MKFAVVVHDIERRPVSGLDPGIGGAHRKGAKERSGERRCDKQSFLLIMRNAGYEAEMDGSSVPMVICRTITDMNAIIPAIRKLVKNNKYKGSFGVRGPRKTDIGNMDFRSSTA